MKRTAMTVLGTFFWLGALWVGVPCLVAIVGTLLGYGPNLNHDEAKIVYYFAGALLVVVALPFAIVGKLLIKHGQHPSAR